MRDKIERQREVEVYDTPSNLGGSFTVSIDEVIDTETVVARIWYGRPTVKGWETVAGLAWRHLSGALRPAEKPAHHAALFQQG